MWIKIEDDVFYISDLSVQYSLIGNCSMTIDIDTTRYPDYHNYFINKYEHRGKFNMSNSRFVANGCFIKSMDIIFKERIVLNILCDMVNTDISDMRDAKIEEILNNENQSE